MQKSIEIILTILAAEQHAYWMDRIEKGRPGAPASTERNWRCVEVYHSTRDL